MNNRLKKLENNIARLRIMKNELSLTDIEQEKTREWALRYGLLESIQIVIDISCHLVVHHNLGNAETYSDCIKLLGEHGFIETDLKKHIMGMMGLRNILIHDYVAVEIKRLYALLDRLDDFGAFARSVEKYFS